MVADNEWNATPESKRSWTDQEMDLLGIVLRMMEIDPTFERLERVFEKALRLVRHLREGQGG